MTEQNVVPNVILGNVAQLQKDVYELKRRSLPAMPATAAPQELIYAKQAYGSANPGAPTIPSIIPADNNYGGIFGLGMTDPSVDSGGWIAYGLGPHDAGGGNIINEAQVAQGTDPATDYGYLNYGVFSSNFGGTQDSDGYLLFEYFLPSGNATGYFNVEGHATDDGADPTSLQLIDLFAEVGAKSSHLKLVAAQEGSLAEQSPYMLMIGPGGGSGMKWMMNNGDPNGTITAPQGSILADIATPALWINMTGSTVWTAF